MSAPIDDLLYGGDDSGDEEEMHAAPVAFGGATPLPLAPGAASGLAAAKPLAAPPVLPGNVATSAPLAAGAKPAVVAAPLAASSAPGAVRPPAAAAQLAKPAVAPAPAAAVAAAPVAAPATVAAAAQAKQAPGSGQQMLQQMFALLKQMLSPEQYATFYSEMRNGNGNDIKSIVDIIKRSAGDAMFSTLIQKLDLTRSFPSTAAASANALVKSEPVATPALAHGAPQRTPSPGLPGAASTAAAAAKTTTAPTTQRPNLLVQTPANGTPTTAVVPPPAISTAPAVAVVKPEPKAVATTAATPPPAAANGTAASPSAKNEQLEKIEFAKKLLFHASTCTLASGVCQVTKCDDVRRVFKHSVSCGGGRSCSHCEQLKGLVKYHAKECLVPASDHCTIPFCDGLRRAYLSSAAAQAAKKTPSAAAAGGSASGSKAGGTSDDDDDNTPLASAVNKAKKNAAKAKSPKASPTVRPMAVTTTTPSAAAAAKKKSPVTAGTTTAKPATAVTTTSPAPTTTAVTNASKPAAAAAGATGGAPAKAAVNANMTVEYGRLLQLILHVQKCTATPCPVGEECAEAKTLLRDINSPNAPPRAKTYKQVYSHYKVCLQKKNTENCPMCKIGLRPILPSASSPLASPASQSTPATGSNNSSTAAGSSAGGGGAASPSSGKRSNSLVTPSPRSPSKKQRTGGTNRVKAAAPLPDPSVQGADQPGLDLAQASIADIRKEADVLTHTNIDLGSERRTMMDSALRRRRMTEQLACKKEEWIEKDLFNAGMLRSQMQEVGQRCGVQLGSHTSDVMAYALNEYLKQVLEEMVEIAKQRGDVQARALEQVQKSGDVKTIGGGATAKHVELTATDILRVSCEDAFARVRQEDLALRAQLLEDAKREELAEKERAKKRKKVDRSRLHQEKDEVEMDIEELAVKDLKDRLLQEDKDGVVRVDGRVNESLSGKFARRLDQQVTLEDATYWLQNQKPYIHPKLFVRAEAARIVTKSLT